MNLLRTRVRRLPGGPRCTASPPALLALLPALLLALSLAAAPARAQEASDLAPVPAYHGYVNDAAGVIGEPRVAQLESFLDQLHKKTGAQFAVLTVQTCEPEDPTQYKTRVFNTWGIGDRFGFNIIGGHNHCATTSSIDAEMAAFLDKFMLGNTNVNTVIRDYPAG